MPKLRADFDWYRNESKRNKLPPRCPIANVELCPHYFESWLILGHNNFATPISEAREADLSKKWELFARAVIEEAPSIITGRDNIGGEKLRGLINFCPEVSYIAFHYFASRMFTYDDANEREAERERYKSEGRIKEFDPEWHDVTPRHYTECREYSIHSVYASGRPTKSQLKRAALSSKLRWKVLERDSYTCAYCGRRPPDVALQIDHKKSLQDGGTDDINNLITSCSECNQGKGSSSA